VETRDEADPPSERGWRPRHFRRSSRASVGEWVLDSELTADPPIEAAEWVDPRRRWEASRPSRRGTIVVHWGGVASVPAPSPTPEPAEPVEPVVAAVVETVVEPFDEPVVETVAEAVPPVVEVVEVPEVVDVVPPAPRPRPEIRPREPNPMWRERVFRGAPAEVQHEAVMWPRRTDG
jgi:hypothetical protein